MSIALFNYSTTYFAVSDILISFPSNFYRFSITRNRCFIKSSCLFNVILWLCFCTFCFLSCFWYFWIRRLCLGAFQKLLSIGFSRFMHFWSNPPNYLPIFYNISQTMRPFLFPTLSIASFFQLFLSFCTESANLGKEIHSQLWWGGEWGIIRYLTVCAVLFVIRSGILNYFGSRVAWWHLPQGCTMKMMICSTVWHLPQGWHSP